MIKARKHFKVFFSILILTLIISCKTEEKPKDVVKTDNEKVEAKKPNEDFSINFEIESDIETKIMVLFKDIEHGKQKVDYTVYLPLEKANNNAKAAMFGDFIPGQLLVEFGRQKQTEFTVKSATILYEDQVINITKDNFQTYFYLNKYITYDKVTGVLKTKRIGKSLAPIATLKPAHFNKIFKLI